MASITTHVLDTALGRPAAGVPITLDMRQGSDWARIGAGSTDADGRLKTLVPAGQTLAAGIYRIAFDTDTYHRANGQPTFYPYAEIVFRIADPSQHFHIPLLLSPFGYSTYRGS